MADPTDTEIRKAMETLVQSVDVDIITMKQFIFKLTEAMGGVDLKARKKFIKATLTEIIDNMQKEEGVEEESEEEDEVEAPPKKKRGAGGLGAEKDISPQLAVFLGQGKTRMARTDVVKQLWEYIRGKFVGVGVVPIMWSLTNEILYCMLSDILKVCFYVLLGLIFFLLLHLTAHNLQNPENKREIILDDAMQTLFGVERFSMFHMAKYVGAHVEPFNPVDLTPKEKDPNKPKKKRKKPGPKGQAEKGAKGKRAKRAKKEPGEKRKTPASFTAPFRLSQDLQDIVGKEIMSRPQVTSALWTYIKANEMQVSL